MRDILADLRLQRDCDRIASLGGRVVYEMLAEIAREHGLRAYLEQKASSYARIDRWALELLGGDRFPARPLRRVGGAP
jgi:hypothetical protein